MIRTRWTVVLFLLLALIFSSCSMLDGSETPQPTATTTPLPTATRRPTQTPTPTPVVIQGTVSIWHSWDEAQLPILVQIIGSFQAMYPEVLFDVLYVPFVDLQERYETEVREGGGPTVLLGPADWGPRLYENGYVANLAELAEADQLETLNTAALGAARYQDALVGLPYTISGVVMYRNEDIISISPSTFEGLVSLANSATQGDTVGAFLDRGFFFSGAHLEGIGGSLMDEDGLPTFNDQKGEAWMDLLKKFELAGPTTYFTDQDLDVFKEGRVGWVIDGTWNLRHLVEILGAENLSIDPWPAYEDGYLSGYVQANNLYLSSRASGDQRLASWKFIEYFLSPEAQTILADYDRLPAASGVVITDPINGPLIVQAMAALAGGATYPVVPEMQAYFLPMDAALKGVLLEGAPPAEMLKAAHDAIQANIIQMRATPTPTP